MVSANLRKAADLALRPKVVALYKNANLLLKKVKLDLSVKEEEFSETIAGDESDPISKTFHQGPQYNQRECGVSNQVGHPCNKRSRDFLQDRLPWNEEMPGQGKRKLFTEFHRPGLLPEGNT